MADPLLKIIPQMMGARMVAYNVSHLKKKKHKPIDLIEQGVGNITGVSMTKEVADFIGE